MKWCKWHQNKHITPLATTSLDYSTHRSPCRTVFQKRDWLREWDRSVSWCCSRHSFGFSYRCPSSAQGLYSDGSYSELHIRSPTISLHLHLDRRLYRMQFAGTYWPPSSGECRPHLHPFSTGGICIEYLGSMSRMGREWEGNTRGLTKGWTRGVTNLRTHMEEWMSLWDEREDINVLFGDMQRELEDSLFPHSRRDKQNAVPRVDVVFTRQHVESLELLPNGI